MEDFDEETAGKEIVVSEVQRYLQETVEGKRRMVVISVVGEELSVSLLGASVVEAVLMQRCALRESMEKIMETAEAIQESQSEAKH